MLVFVVSMRMILWRVARNATTVISDPVPICLRRPRRNISVVNCPVVRVNIVVGCVRKLPGPSSATGPDSSVLFLIDNDLLAAGVSARRSNNGRLSLIIFALVIS